MPMQDDDFDKRPSSKYYLLLLLFSLLLGSCGQGGKEQLARGERDSLRKEMSRYSLMGYALRDSSQYLAASEMHQRELSLAQQLDDTLMVINSLNSLGSNYRRMGIFNEALDYYGQVLVMIQGARSKGDSRYRKCQAVAYNGLGNVYTMMGNYADADSVLRIALAIETELGSENGMNVDNANLGRVFELRGQLDSAWNYYNRAFYHSKRYGSALSLAYSHVNFGRVYEKRHQYAKAIKEFNLAFGLIDGKKDLWLWLQPCIALARIHMLTGDLTTSEGYLSDALRVAKSINSTEYLVEIYGLYSELYQKRGDYEKALDNFTLSTNYEDSLVDMKKLFQLQNQRINYARKQKDMEMLQMHVDLQSERQSKGLIITILFLALAVTGSLLATYWYIAGARRRTAETLRKLSVARDHFFTNITHEFRTPLTIIQGIGEELAETDFSGSESTGELEKAIHHKASIIVRQGNSLLLLINQILDIAKLQTAVSTAPQWRHGDIVGFIGMACESFQELASRKGITIDYRPAQPSLPMDIIPDYLHKVVGNLLSNAIKFSFNDSRIILTTDVADERLVLRISDEGIGMTEEQKARVFEPFYQADTESRNIGTGVGLSLLRLAVTAMDGTVNVESEPGRGTTFEVKMPLRHAGGEWEPMGYDGYGYFLGSAGAEEEQPPQDDSLDDDSATRVLIVEDSAMVAEYIGQQLGGEYRLFYAADGESGWEKALQLVPDIIITDVMMPRLDGCLLCRRIRRSDLLGHVPVVMVTAKVTHEDKMQGLEAGADAYLEKPFHGDELNRRVERLLEQQQLMRKKLLAELENSPVEKMEQEGQEEQQAEERKGEVLSAVNKQYLERFTREVETQLKGGKVDVSRLAEAMFVSRAQLNRKIRAITGQTTTGYIADLRVNKAKLLLKEHPEMSISEVAYHCGIEDTPYFITLFKRKTGQTPGAWRETVSEE